MYHCISDALQEENYDANERRRHLQSHRRGDFHQRQSRKCVMFAFFCSIYDCTHYSVTSTIHMDKTMEHHLVGGCSKCYIYIQ